MLTFTHDPVIKSTYILMRHGWETCRARLLTPSDRRHAFDLMRAEWQPVVSVALRWTADDGPLGDFLWAAGGMPLLVSMRVIDVLRARSFCGWQTYDVALSDGDGMPLRGYAGLAIWGRCGPVAARRGGRPHTFPEGHQIAPAIGLGIDLKTWDGSDLFCSRDGSGWIFVSASVKAAFENAALTGFRCLPARNVRYFHDFISRPASTRSGVSKPSVNRL